MSEIKFPPNVNVHHIKGPPQSGKSTLARTIARGVECQHGEYLYVVPTKDLARSMLKRHAMPSIFGGKVTPKDISLAVDTLIIDDANWGPAPYMPLEIEALALKLSLRQGFSTIVLVETVGVGEGEYERGVRHGYSRRQAEVLAALV